MYDSYSLTGYEAANTAEPKEEQDFQSLLEPFGVARNS